MHASVNQSSLVNNDFRLDGDRVATPEETASWLLDDGPVLKTRWMIYDRQFSDGQREITASKFVTIKQTGPLGGQSRARRGESEKRSQNDDDSAKRARQAARLRCKAIGADRMITLTYRENMQDRERLKRDYDLFRRRMSKCRQFHYVATVERQERGAFHIHIAVRGRQSYQLVRSIWQSVVGTSTDGKSGGQINVRDPHKFGFGQKGQHKLAAYITKYITKDMSDHELNAKRYWTSRGIVIPEKNYYQLPYGTSASEAFAHVMQLAADHNNDGMQFFANQALGCCWVATAPVTNSYCCKEENC